MVVAHGTHLVARRVAGWLDACYLLTALLAATTRPVCRCSGGAHAVAQEPPFPNTGQADPQTLEVILSCPPYSYTVLLSDLVAPNHTRLTALPCTRLVPHVLLLPSRLRLPPIVSNPPKARLVSMPILVRPSSSSSSSSSSRRLSPLFHCDCICTSVACLGSNLRRSSPPP